MNRRSPRVVRSPSTPRRGAPPGTRHSHTAMISSSSAITPKNAAVCQVHAIQLRPVPTLACMVSGALNAAEGEALGDVVANEVDDDRTGHDRQRTGGGQQPELVTRGAGG